jgi:hypothetical protein
MKSEEKRDYERVADILIEALAMAEGIDGGKVLVYLINLSLMEADKDYHSREYFRGGPQRAQPRKFELSA